MSTLSCDIVMDGAFFSQSDFQVPKKKVGQHAGQHVLVPPTEFSDLVVIQSQFALGFLETLFDCPSQSGEPNKTVQPSADRSIADEIRILQFFVDLTPPDDKPDFFARKAFFIKCDAPFCKLIANGAFGALGNCSFVPVEIVQRLGEI